MSINIVKKLKKQGGFTLLELLIVIVIIGILALLIIPNITSAPKKARDTQRKTDLTGMRKSLEEYFVSNNSYPVDTSALTAGTSPLMKTLPADPKTPAAGFSYVYTPTGTPPASYTLTACLENGSDNGTNTGAPVSPCPATSRTYTLTSAN